MIVWIHCDQVLEVVDIDWGCDGFAELDRHGMEWELFMGSRKCTDRYRHAVNLFLYVGF